MTARDAMRSARAVWSASADRHMHFFPILIVQGNTAPCRDAQCASNTEMWPGHLYILRGEQTSDAVRHTTGGHNRMSRGCRKLCWDLNVTWMAHQDHFRGGGSTGVDATSTRMSFLPHGRIVRCIRCPPVCHLPESCRDRSPSFAT